MWHPKDGRVFFLNLNKTFFLNCYQPFFRIFFLPFAFSHLKTQGSIKNVIMTNYIKKIFSIKINPCHIQRVILYYPLIVVFLSFCTRHVLFFLNKSFLLSNVFPFLLFSSHFSRYIGFFNSLIIIF